MIFYQPPGTKLAYPVLPPSFRPKPGQHSKWPDLISIALTATLTLIATSVAFRLQNQLCPASTFARGYVGAESIADSLMPLLGPISYVGFVINFTMWLDTRFEPSHRTPPGEARTRSLWIAVSLAGLLISGVMAVERETRLFCLTPSEITIRNGYSDPTRNMSWDDVKIVRAMCWLNNTGRRSSPVGMFDLIFRDGTEIIARLTNGIYILPKLDAIKEALTAKEFKYQIDASVTPNKCPRTAYQQLLKW